MSFAVGPTHDPNLRSWVESASDPESDFPVQNLPFGIFRRAGLRGGSVGVAIGDRILDLRAASAAGQLDMLPVSVREAVAATSLNRLMGLAPDDRSGLRGRLSELLSNASFRHSVNPHLVPMAHAEMLLPAAIGDYTDFYASIFHATNVGKLFRPDSPLLPNYKYVPIGYHGRASSIVVSGSGVRRPNGQRKDPNAESPVFGPSQALDYELELGFFVGPGSSLGETIPIGRAWSHIFGAVLVNDWSARDIQSWEYQPLGPFLSKSFATTISPWVVTMEALAPFRVPAYTRPQGDPEPLPYLRSPEEAAHGGVDITLEVRLSTARMRGSGLEPVRISRSNFRDLYWTIGQLVTHHASNGCNLRAGDLLASGTVSGPHPGEQGCLLETTRRGAEPMHVGAGEIRKFLEDGDEVVFRGYCDKDGFARIGFGECRGVVAEVAL